MFGSVLNTSVRPMAALQTKVTLALWKRIIHFWKRGLGYIHSLIPKDFHNCNGFQTYTTPETAIHRWSLKKVLNILQIYRRAPMPKCDFNKAAKKKVFWKYAANIQENTHAEVWFQHPFLKNTSGRLLLNIRKTILVITYCLNIIWVVPFSIYKVNCLFFSLHKEFSIKDFFSKCDRILKKSLMENFIFCAVFIVIWVLPIALRHWGNP